MSKVQMYCTQWCPYCTRAEMLLKRKGVEFEKIIVENNQQLMDEMISRSGRSTVPQIFIGETHVGGFDDMAELDMGGDLDALLAAELGWTPPQ